jgi:hypothetical protein
MGLYGPVIAALCIAIELKKEEKETKGKESKQSSTRVILARNG